MVMRLWEVRCLKGTSSVYIWVTCWADDLFHAYDIVRANGYMTTGAAMEHHP